MKCFTRVKSNAYAPTSTNIISQNMIYWQMSKHYKRIKSAKKVVDTSAPLHGKLSNVPAKRTKTVSECHTPLSASSISKLNHDGIPETVTDISEFCDKGYKQHLIHVRGQQTEKRNTHCKRVLKNYQRDAQNHKYCIDNSHKPAVKSRTCSKTLENNINGHRKGRSMYDIIEVHSKDFIAPDKPFKPRILKTDAEPRIRNLRVYYPPRKKSSSRKSLSDTRCNVSVENGEELCEVAGNISAQASTYSTDSDSHRTWNGDQEVQFLPDYVLTNGKRKLGSELSSRDSAYNGGISSGGESRGSSPEQNQNQLANLDSETDKENDGSFLNKNDCGMHDPYLKFTNNIINTIIKNNTLSSNGIKNIIKQCISEHGDQLDKVRMAQEVKKLLEQLDVDIDDQQEFNLSGNKEPGDSELSNQHCESVNNTVCEAVINNVINDSFAVEPDVHDPFDDDLLLQEYRSELRKMNIEPDFIFPSSGGVEMTVEYMCAYPFTENATSQDFLEEELWIHPYKSGVSNNGSEIYNSSKSECKHNCTKSECAQTLHCSEDGSSINSNVDCLLQNNSDNQRQDNEQVFSQHLLYDIADIPQSGCSDSSEVSVLSELFIGCRLNDT